MMPYHVLKLSSVQRGKKVACAKRVSMLGEKRCRVQKLPKSGNSLISSRQGAVERRES